MIYFKKLKIRVVSPYYYFSLGGQFADTQPFIGDIALMYAIAYSQRRMEYPIIDRRARDIKRFGFITSIGKPINLKTKNILTVSSAFKDSIALFREVLFKTGGTSPYKNIRKIKAIDFGSEFECYIFSKNKNFIENLPKKFGVRFGVAKEGVLEIEVKNGDAKDYIWMNLYTLTILSINKILEKNKKLILRPINKYYNIIEGLTVKETVNMLKNALTDSYGN